MRIKRVTIHRLSLPELIEFVDLEYKEMWLQLGGIARRWHKERELLLNDSERLCKIVQDEEEMFRLTTSKR